MIKGSCLCGAIAYELSERPEIMNLCHCAMCRKMSGSSYGTFAHIEIEKFRWIHGEENVQRYQSSPDHIRSFCKHCGSNVPNEDDDEMCIPAGTLDDDPGITPRLQIFEDHKAPWQVIDTHIESFAKFPPDEWEP